jgi:hypothetical protein
MDLGNRRSWSSRVSMRHCLYRNLFHIVPRIGLNPGSEASIFLANSANNHRKQSTLNNPSYIAWAWNTHCNWKSLSLNWYTIGNFGRFDLGSFYNSLKGIPSDKLHCPDNSNDLPGTIPNSPHLSSFRDSYIDLHSIDRCHCTSSCSEVFPAKPLDNWDKAHPQSNR